MKRFLSRMAKVLQSRKGSPTMEYIIVIACGVALALLLNQVMAFAEVQGSLKDKIMQVLTGQNMVASVDESPKEQSLEERKDDLFGKPEWINDLISGYQSLKNKFKQGLSEVWENVKNKDLGEVTQSLWNNTTNAFDSAWQWVKENKEAVASAGVIIAGVGLLLIPGMEPLGLMLLANWGLSLGFGALLNGGKVDKTVMLGAAIGGAAGAIGGGAAGAFFSGLTKFAPGLGTAITGSRFLGPIISGGKQILGKAPAFVQRMAGGLFSKMGAMTVAEGAITSGVDDRLRGKELNWKRAVLSGLAGATLVGFASGTYPLVQPLINKATATIEKHAGSVVSKVKPVIKNVDKCFAFKQTPQYFALIRFGNENIIECLYAQVDRGSGGETSKISNSSGAKVNSAQGYSILVSNRTQLTGNYKEGTQASVILREELKKAGVEAPPYPNAAHHIIPWNDPRAREAQQLLKEFGINENSAANGVFLPYVDNNHPQGKYVGDEALHRGNHGQNYIRYVTQRLRLVKLKGGTTSDAVKEINQIRAKLLDGSLSLN